MEDDKKNKSNAPSSDTTSALFVSARKKQLEQQAAEKIAKEKEEQRLAAEAEVRRLEAEVEERRRKAEEEARRVELEAAEFKRKADEDAQLIAAEARLKKERAAENPDSVLSAAASQISKLAKGDLFKNKKLLGIIGGLALVLIIALAAALGGGAEPVTASGSDFSGLWYNGDSDIYDTYEFQDEGKLKLTFADGETADGQYTVSGEDVKIVYDDFEQVFKVEGNVMTGEAAVLTRELQEPNRENQERVIDVNAKVDKSVNIPFLRMNVFYPSSLFKVGEQTDKNLLIEDIHGDGALAIINVTNFPYQQQTPDFNVYRTFLREGMAAALSGQKDVSIGKLMDRPAPNNRYVGSMMEAAYTDAESGQAMVVSIEVNFWTNEATKNTYVTLYTYAYPENKPVYAKLLSAIIESRKDS